MMCGPVAPSRAPMMTAMKTEGGVGSRRCTYHRPLSCMAAMFEEILIISDDEFDRRAAQRSRIRMGEEREERRGGNGGRDASSLVVVVLTIWPLPLLCG